MMANCSHKDIDIDIDKTEEKENERNAEEMDAALALLELETSIASIESEKNDGCNENVCDKGVQVTQTILQIKNRFSIMQILNNDSDLNAFTGISTVKLFTGICKSAELFDNKDQFALKIDDRILLTMIKLKLNISYKCLAVLFQVTRQTCKNYFQVTIGLLSKILETVVFLPEKNAIQSKMPNCFSKFKNTRLILDCTEVEVEKTKCINCRLRTYSHYKGTSTVKFLVATVPSGMIAYVSKAYGGRASDKQIFCQSGILQKLIPTVDAIMVDKGFLIEKECLANHISLIQPPFLGKNKQLSERESIVNAEIASARVHVERTIQRIKIFKILHGKLQYHMLPFIDSIMTVIAGIVNLSRPILAEDKFKMSEVNPEM